MAQGDLLGALRHLVPSFMMGGAVMVVIRARRLPLVEALGLTPPRAGRVLPWLLGGGLWFLASEWLMSVLGMPSPEHWLPEATPLHAVRFLGMVVLAPASEELMFRGLLYGRFVQTRLGVPGAILLPALLFAALHIQYGAGECTFIFLDAVVFGLARRSTGSVLVPIALHALGNLYAFLQRLPWD